MNNEYQSQGTELKEVTLEEKRALSGKSQTIGSVSDVNEQRKLEIELRRISKDLDFAGKHEDAHAVMRAYKVIQKTRYHLKKQNDNHHLEQNKGVTTDEN